MKSSLHVGFISLILILMESGSNAETNQSCPIQQMTSCMLLKIKSTYHPFKDWYLFVKNNFMYGAAQQKQFGGNKLRTTDLEDWKASCDIFRSYFRCLLPLIKPCYDILSNANMIKEMSIYKYICDELHSHPIDLACVHRRLKMSKTFPCYMLNNYNIMRGSGMLKNLTESNSIICYDAKVALDCIVKVIKPYCNKRASNIFIKVVRMWNQFCNSLVEKYPGKMNNPLVWSLLNEFSNYSKASMVLEKYSIGEPFKTKFQMMAKSWECFTLEQWSNMPTEQDGGWFRGFPIFRGYLIKNVLRKDWFDSVCHSLGSHIKPCVSKVKEEYKHSGYQNFIVEGLTYLCKMSYQNLNLKIYNLLLCTEEKDELSTCTAPILAPSSIQILVTGGQGSILPPDRQTLMDEFCWVHQNVSACIAEEYRQIQSKCGKDLTETLLALRKILLLYSKNYFVPLYYYNVYEPAVQFWPFKPKIEDVLKLIIVNDPFTGNVMSFCPHM